MATLQQVRDAISAKLQGVTVFGNGHQFERFAAREADFKTFYYDATAKRINGWNFFRKRSRETEIDIGLLQRLDEWEIKIFRGLDDADQTGLTFDDDIETTVAAFRSDPTLGGVVTLTKDMEQPRGPMGLQVNEINIVTFAGVLCHRAVLSLVTETEVAI